MRARLANFVGCALLAVGCASTQMTSAWKNPTYLGAAPRKVLVVAVVGPPSVRSSLEEQLAGQLNSDRIEAVPLVHADASGATPNIDSVERALRQGSFDGLLIARGIGVSERESYAPGYPGWDGHWGPYGPTPTYIVLTPQAHIESSLFDMRANGQLIWTGSAATLATGGDGAYISDADIAKYASVVISELKRAIG